jgi:anti-sigma regulatory factor (Ser/Thr protein kinase)
MKNDAIYPLCPERQFFGRQREIDYICNRATELHKLLPGMFLYGKRWIGKTEVLRRVYQWLFWNQAGVVPIYYQFKGVSCTENFADDYILETVKQCLAFIKRDPQNIKADPTLNELEKMLTEIGASDVAELVSKYKEAKREGDRTAALKNAIRVPYVLSLQWGISIFLILDDTNRITEKDPSMQWSAIVWECVNLLRHESFSFLMAGITRRIFPSEALNVSVEVIELAGLEEELAVSMMVELCHHNNTQHDTEILAITARKLEGNPLYLKSIVWSASKMGRGFSSLKDFADVYAYTLINGNLGFSLNSAISLETFHDLKVLHVYAAYSDRENSVEEVAGRLKCDPDTVKMTVDRLISFGLLENNLGSIVWTGGNVIKDFVGYVYGTRVAGKTVEEVRTLIVSKELKEGFSAKGEKVEGRIKAEIIDVVKAFIGQNVPAALFHNPIYATHSKNGIYPPGLDEKGNNTIQLPQVVGCFDAMRWEKNESGMPIIIARGFKNGRYDAVNEVVWIVGIKELTLPINADDATDFIRRSSLLQRHFKPSAPVRWVVGTEGFTNDALHRLAGEGVYTTDDEQLGMLKNVLERSEAAAPYSCTDVVAPNKEFDVVLPISPRAELVAARAAEEIGAGMGFDGDSVSRIKAALVEACINAFEHCKIKGSKVYLKFVAGNDRLVVQVQNKGALFDRMPAPGAVTEPVSGLPHKRGWGMELMKGLMDEVRLETLSSGTRIVLIKYLPGKGGKL